LDFKILPKHNEYEEVFSCDFEEKQKVKFIRFVWKIFSFRIQKWVDTLNKYINQLNQTETYEPEPEPEPQSVYVVFQQQKTRILWTYACDFRIGIHLSSLLCSSSFAYSDYVIVFIWFSSNSKKNTNTIDLEEGYVNPDEIIVRPTVIPRIKEQDIIYEETIENLQKYVVIWIDFVWKQKQIPI